MKYFQHNKTLKFGIIDVDNKDCRKLTTRFKVKRVPYTTFINKDKMYPFTEIFTPGRIIDFINHLNTSNYHSIPEDPFEKKKNFNKNINIKKLSFYEQSKINFQEYINSLNEPMTQLLNKYSINIEWTNKKTYISFLIFLILLFPTEYYFFKFIILCFFVRRNDEKKFKLNINDLNNNKKENKNINEENNKTKNEKIKEKMD